MYNNEEKVTHDFNVPKRGRITKLIVKQKCRGMSIGKQLLDAMKDYLKSIGCKKTLIAVFGYNENAIHFYTKNGYHMRMVYMIED